MSACDIEKYYETFMPFKKDAKQVELPLVVSSYTFKTVRWHQINGLNFLSWQNTPPRTSHQLSCVKPKLQSLAD